MSFLLVVITLVLGGAFASNDVARALCLLWGGVVVCGFLVPPIIRANARHSLIMEFIYKHRKDHIATVVKKHLEDARTVGSMRDLIGYYFPVLCWAFLLLIAIAGSMGWLPLDNGVPQLS